jgi:methylase of polypeptide subunit release factors
VWAPIESPKVILESGTGNGIWALEMAAHYTDSKIIGMDLSPPTIQYGNPNNLSYNQTNINEAWPVAKESVD